LLKSPAIEQRGRKTTPAERAEVRNPGFAERRFRNSLQIRPYSEFDLEQIRVLNGTGRGLLICFFGRPLAMTPGRAACAHPGSCSFVPSAVGFAALIVLNDPALPVL
jgi:hypothetical protein